MNETRTAEYGLRAEPSVQNIPVPTREKPLYGLMVEFEEHAELLTAAKKTYAAGYRQIDAFSPFPIEGLAEAIGHEFTSVPLFTLLGGICGGLGGYFMEWYSMSRLYPVNVGGRPLHTWPHFIPVTFELTVLIASFSALIAMLALNRLPQPYHPVFNVPEFRRASIDRFFLCIEVADPKFEREGTWVFLQTLGGCNVSEVVE